MEIAGLIISILSLLATIAVSFAIYWLQRRHEKEMDREDDRRRRENLCETAKIFIIDNQEDIKLLPLCVMAASVNKYKTHNRQIYTKFNKCSKEVQQEILIQENVSIKVIQEENWFEDCFKKFQRDCKTYELGRDFFYDIDRYFHSAFRNYAKVSTENIETNIFNVPQISEIAYRFADLMKESHNVELTLYIDRYLEYVLRDREDTANNPELLPQEKPFEMLNKKLNLGNCDIKTMLFWIMQSIMSACIAFWRHDLIKDDKQEWRQINIESDLITTYEDMYYETLLILFETYYKI